MPKNRIRQHVNPLSQKYQQLTQIPDWTEIYHSPNQPFHLDIGCATGKFLLQMAQLHSDINFLGVEIRESLVKNANQDRDKLGLTNLHYYFSNINISAPKLLATLPANKLQCITIQFPDPWFKKRHNKRRIVQSTLVNTLVDYLIVGGTVFLQSDIYELALEMRDRFAANPHLIQQHPENWLSSNPFAVPTERELYVLASSQPVYRVLFKKFSSSISSQPN